MENFFNNIFKRKEIENREKNKKIKPDVLVFDDTEDQFYGDNLDLDFNKEPLSLDRKSIASSEVGEFFKRIKEEQPDVIFIVNPDKINENLFKDIVKLRNDKNIKRQPIILVLTSDRNIKEVEKIQKYATDVIKLQPFLDTEEISSWMSSIPEMLGHIEDEYGDKMMKNKISFYKEYKDKLAERSDFTADTEKELKMLEEIFEKNKVKKVLDAGGGEGRIAIPLSQKNYEVVNIDASEELILKMNEKQKEKDDFEKVSGVVGDLKEMSIESESQEAITFNWHIFCDILGKKSKKKTLEEAYRVLKIGGVIVLDIPDRVGGSYEKDGVYIQNPGGENIFIGYAPSEKEMKDYLKEANFRNIEVRKWETKRGFKKITFIAKKLV